MHTPDLLARLRQLVELGDAYVVLDGGIGTLLELFLVWNLLAIRSVHKPCLLVGAHWHDVLASLSQQTQIGPQHIAMLRIVDTPAEAVRALQT
jgi:predicted Rossmann-fold nucleotide-binding protein